MKPLAVIVAAFALAGCTSRADPVAPAGPSACTIVSEAEMVWIPAGEVMLGANPREPEEGPPRRVDVAGFWMATHEVTNAEFARFVAATGYQTLAERPPPAMPGAPPAMLRPGSAVFATPDAADPRWWRWREGAQWRRPRGGAVIEARPLDPVVQVAHADAQAYARWRGLALPTEAQWERAARLGGVDLDHADADRLPLANTWQGVFPVRDLGTDGFRGPAPVGCFPRDRAGLYDMIGNVWEWTADRAPDAPDQADPRGVIKGGSYLCAANACARYRPAARQFQERGLGTDHIGFRVIDPTRAPPPIAQVPSAKGSSA